MTRRRRARAPFSLFSFQDIITCVTGIIILITLVLALELTQRKLSAPTVTTSLLASQIEKVIEEAQAEVARLDSKVGQQTSEAETLAGLAAATVRRDLFDANEQIKSLTAELEELSRHESTAVRADEKIQAERFNRKPDEQHLADLEAETEELDAELQAVLKENRVYFNPRTADGKRVWLVQIADARILIAPAGVKSRPTVFAQMSSRRRRSAFSEWLDKRSPASDFVFVLVRSEGIEEFDELKKLITGQGFGIGFDLLGAEQSAVDPKTGAASL